MQISHPEFLVHCAACGPEARGSVHDHPHRLSISRFAEFRTILDRWRNAERFESHARKAHPTQSPRDLLLPAAVGESSAAFHSPLSSDSLSSPRGLRGTHHYTKADSRPLSPSFSFHRHPVDRPYVTSASPAPAPLGSALGLYREAVGDMPVTSFAARRQVIPWSPSISSFTHLNTDKPRSHQTSSRPTEALSAAFNIRNDQPGVQRIPGSRRLDNYYPLASHTSPPPDLQRRDRGHSRTSSESSSASSTSSSFFSPVPDCSREMANYSITPSVMKYYGVFNRPVRRGTIIDLAPIRHLPPRGQR
jgi:hypothetical protein